MTVRIVVNPTGVRRMLVDPHVASDLARRARAIAEEADRRAGTDRRGRQAEHRVETETGGRRARAAVITANARARIKEATDRTLTSSIDAGRR